LFFGWSTFHEDMSATISAMDAKIYIFAVFHAIGCIDISSYNICNY